MSASSELRSHIKSIRDCLVRVLFTNNALAECTMNEKFSILHEAAGAECNTEKFERVRYLQTKRSQQSLTLE